LGASALADAPVLFLYSEVYPEAGLTHAASSIQGASSFCEEVYAPYARFFPILVVRRCAWNASGQYQLMEI